jgi:hypothetical protein
MHDQSAVATLVASVTGTATAGAAGGVVVGVGAGATVGVVTFGDVTIAGFGVATGGDVVVVVVVGGEVVVVDTTGRLNGMANPAMAEGRNLAGTMACPLVVPCAEAACRDPSVKIPVVNPAMTANAVVSAMRIRTAPPFVGRARAPGSARWGRAPAIAYAPRTESGKASSVLAWLPQGVRPVV